MVDFYSDREKVLDMVTSQEKPPISTVTIANTLGINVYRIKGWKKLSGMIKRDDSEDAGPSGYTIYTNADHDLTRRRFTIAHEIAHYVLHKSLIGDGITEDALYRSGLSNKIEEEANEFAAKLLMPEHLIRPATRKESSIEKLAEQFNVSGQAIAIRLRVPQA